MNIIMLTQPKLVKSDTPQNKGINLKSQTKGSARFLLGLNNRVSHIDKRLTRLEATSDHILRHHIGYKELSLTFVLALLMFTSISLGLQTFQPSLTTQQQASSFPLIHNPLEANTITENNAATFGVKTSNGITDNNFKWPLEKQPILSQVEYSQHKHGIEITSKLGDPIVAIDKGEVIYSGNAINSYGNLILVQHSNNIISVYGNNYSNYVYEGDHVSQGQLIAAVGEGDGKRARLYFEIRYKGKAQDPFLYFK